MNRLERRSAIKSGMNEKEAFDKTLKDTYMKGVFDGIHSTTKMYYYMIAYTLQYKLDLNQKDLVETVAAIFNNIDSFRTGHLTQQDFVNIMKEMNEMGIKME